MKPEKVGCIGKHRFESMQIANQVVTNFGKRHHGAHCVYKCIECGGWHIGNSLTKKKFGKRNEQDSGKNFNDF